MAKSELPKNNANATNTDSSKNANDHTTPHDSSDGKGADVPKVIDASGDHAERDGRIDDKIDGQEPSGRSDTFTNEHGEQEPYRYDAFISYRHVERDRRWAKWLHKTLETYKVPAKVLSQPGIKPLIGRVFRDEEELPVSSDLTREIDLALEQSRFLIVICSTATPASRWVDEEVKRFHALGRSDRILALLVEGEPNTAFPKAMTERRRKVMENQDATLAEMEAVEPLAADVRLSRTESTRALTTVAKIRFVACILGCRFDDLRQRDQLRNRKRNRIVVAISSSLILLFLILGGLAIYQGKRAKQEQVAAQKARTEAIKQRDLALETLNPLISMQDELLERSGTRKIQEKILEDALRKLEKIQESAATDDYRADQNTAIALQKRGNLYLLAGKTSQAQKFIDRSANILSRLHQNDTKDVVIIGYLSRAHHLLGMLGQRTGKMRAAAEHYQKALDLRELIAAQKPKDVKAQIDLGESYEYLGDALIDLGDSLGGMSFYQRSLDVRQAVLNANLKDPKPMREVAVAYSKLGDASRVLGNSVKARKYYKLSAKLFAFLADEDMYNTRSQRNYAVALNKLGAVSNELGDMKDATKYFKHSLKITKSLAKSDKENKGWQRELSLCLSNLGYTYSRANDYQSAEDYYQRALAIVLKLATDDSDNIASQRDLADAYQLLGNAKLKLGQTRKALGLLNQSLKIRETLAKIDADNTAAKRDLSIAYDKLGDLNRYLGDTPIAITYYLKSLAVRNALASADPNNVQVQHDLAVSYNRLARVSSTQKAIAYYRKALSARKRQVQVDPKNVMAQNHLAVAYHMLGTAIKKLDLVEEAADDFTQSLHIFEKLAIEKNDAKAKRQLPLSYVTVADITRELGKPKQAVAYYKKAVQVLDQLAKADPKHIRYQTLKIEVLAKQADNHLYQRQIKEALVCYQRAQLLAQSLEKQGKLIGRQHKWPTNLQTQIANIRAAVPLVHP